MGDDLRHFPHTITKCQCVKVACVHRNTLIWRIIRTTTILLYSHGVHIEVGESWQPSWRVVSACPCGRCWPTWPVMHVVWHVLEQSWCLAGSYKQRQAQSRWCICTYWPERRLDFWRWTMKVSKTKSCGWRRGTKEYWCRWRSCVKENVFY